MGLGGAGREWCESCESRTPHSISRRDRWIDGALYWRIKWVCLVCKVRHRRQIRVK